MDFGFIKRLFFYCWAPFDPLFYCNFSDRDLFSEKELVENCKASFTGDKQKFAELQLRVGRLLSPGNE